MNRMETAKAIADKTNGRVWTSGNDLTDIGVKVRVYAAKGFAEIDSDGNVNIDRVGGHEFGAYKAACEEIGVKSYRK